jgi:hypothetical protein
MGNDFSDAAQDVPLMANLMAGIQATDKQHMQTTELFPTVSGSLDDPTFLPYIELGGAYTYYPTYDKVLDQYNKSTTIPIFLEEAHYELEAVGTGEMGTPLVLRHQGYWTALSGGVGGQLYGNHYTWTFASGWQNNLDRVGVVQLQIWKNFFMSMPWYKLVPDQNHTVVTAGYGTYDTTTTLTANTYATAARASDGSLIVVYTPVTHSLTVDMTKLSGSATAQWFDPTNGATTTISGSPFANTGTHVFTSPGANSTGDQDWVLVLTAP